MSARLLSRLTRPELDELLRSLEHASRVAHIAMSEAPLWPEGEVAARCGVAGDVDLAWQDALDESITRMWQGEKL